VIEIGNRLRKLWRLYRETPAGFPPPEERDFLDFLTLSMAALLGGAFWLVVLLGILELGVGSKAERTTAIALVYLGGVLLAMEALARFIPRARDALSFVVMVFAAGVFFFPIAHNHSVFPAIGAAVVAGPFAGACVYFGFNVKPRGDDGEVGVRSWVVGLGMLSLTLGFVLQVAEVLIPC
jgi:hypothetical protein